ncbi:MAG: prepilin peptidase [Pseudomonadota bacterium]
MAMTYLPLGAASCLFLGVMVHAMITDVRHRQIMNQAVLVLALGYLPMALICGLAASEMLMGLAMALVVFAAGFACFCAGWMGGGDVKLGAATALWLGAGQVPAFLLLSAILGAVLCIGILAYRRWRSPVEHRPGIPYGPALVVAAVVLFPSSPWFAAV